MGKYRGGEVPTRECQQQQAYIVMRVLDPMSTRFIVPNEEKSQSKCNGCYPDLALLVCTAPLSAFIAAQITPLVSRWSCETMGSDLRREVLRKQEGTKEIGCGDKAACAMSRTEWSGVG